MDKISLIGVTKEQLHLLLQEKIPSFSKRIKMRTQQLWYWIYHYGAKSFYDMTNISLEHRSQLDSFFSLSRPECLERAISSDGTRKYLFQFGNCSVVESVFIPDVSSKNSNSVCLSSQVGCSLKCSFCYTGSLGLLRNLTHEEIVSQIFCIKDDIGDWNNETNSRYINNVVFMGMGEPLLNLKNVLSAIDIISDEEGIALSRRRITVSTVGIVTQMSDLAKNGRTQLAVSLHSPFNHVRSEIMPINKKFPIEILMKSCIDYLNVSNTKKVTFEYVMLEKINDKIRDAQELLSVVSKIPCKINCIPLNPFPNIPFKPSSLLRIKSFVQYIRDNGIVCTIRKTRGQDIMAACGQLAAQSTKISL